MTNLSSSDNGIDFVLTWVDGNDPAWQSEFCRFDQEDGDKRDCRFRDWDNLKYLFRCFESFLPWFRKIHFVTCGHLPPWLNTNHDKLNIVTHDQYIEQKYLPVFNSTPIEINFHKIPGLSERFVYFNDDTFILRKLKPERFFRDGIPCDIFAFNTICDSKIANIKINDIQILHKYFDKYDVVRNNFFKIFHYKYPLIEMVKTLLVMPWPKITGFYDTHMPQPFLKSDFEALWALEKDELQKTSSSRFRSKNNLNQYLFRYYNLCKGNFRPANVSKSKFEWVYGIDDARRVSEFIAKQKYEMICFNDGLEDESEFERIKELINQAFDSILPEKSSFEK